MGRSSWHLFALAWWPPGVASFWAADNLGEFQVVWGDVSRPPRPRLPEAAVLLNSFPGILPKLQKLRISSSLENSLSDAQIQNKGMVCLAWGTA